MIKPNSGLRFPVAWEGGAGTRRAHTGLQLQWTLFLTLIGGHLGGLDFICFLSAGNTAYLSPKEQLGTGSPWIKVEIRSVNNYLVLAAGSSVHIISFNSYTWRSQFLASVAERSEAPFSTQHPNPLHTHREEAQPQAGWKHWGPILSPHSLVGQSFCAGRGKQRRLEASQHKDFAQGGRQPIGPESSEALPQRNWF